MDHHSQPSADTQWVQCGQQTPRPGEERKRVMGYLGHWLGQFLACTAGSDPTGAGGVKGLR